MAVLVPFFQMIFSYCLIYCLGYSLVEFWAGFLAAVFVDCLKLCDFLRFRLGPPRPGIAIAIAIANLSGFNMFLLLIRGREELRDFNDYPFLCGMYFLILFFLLDNV